MKCFLIAFGFTLCAPRIKKPCAHAHKSLDLLAGGVGYSRTLRRLRLFFKRSKAAAPPAKKSRTRRREKQSSNGSVQRSWTEEIGGSFLSGGGLKSITQRIVVPPPQATFSALALPRFDQVLQAARSLDRWLAALCAALVALHPQLVLSLPGNRQIRELVLDSFSHRLVLISPFC